MESYQEDKEKIRLKTICEIVENFNKKFEGVFKYNSKNIEKIINDYWSNLSKWKKYFKISTLDRHKVAALTVHYFLKNNPIEIIKNTPYSPFLCESIAISIAFSRLKTNGKDIQPAKNTYTSLLKLLSDHKNLIKDNKLEKIQYSVRAIAIILCNIEEKHLILSDQPQ
ncbi:MAG TPA: hypothetical protein DHW82_09715 [Spirochaetia bacterium]|nr:MAG: hypothetical protein A2Y41_00445 [Spirochaetes bacterium GWB1_36_13]HCL57268.1 hypothetical protein [Spirochaetia bacterium]